MEDKIVRFLEKTLGVLLAAMVVLLFLQVVTRYIFRGHLLWAGEMAVWTFVWISYLGSVVLYIKKKHIVVDLLSAILPKRINRVMEGVASVCVVVFLSLLFYHSIPVVVSYSKQQATSIGISKLFLFSSLTVSCALMLLYSLYRMVRHLRRR
ncbi:MAG: TRAP transporter small permease [Spirochaetes bacterium]|nr:TRAP transporter small permease [Spirochaetota bacterium]